MKRYSSPSSMQPAEISSYDDYVIEGRTPLRGRKQLPIKTTIAAIVMLIAGIVLISVGLSILLSSWLSHGKDRGVLLVVLGGISKSTILYRFDPSMPNLRNYCKIVFLPGSYASIVLYGSYRGWTGYDYSLIPSYDDE
eukprot:gene24428-29527_t